MLTWLQRDSLSFPALEKALQEPNGLLAAGGDLSPERLIQAYRMRGHQAADRAAMAQNDVAHARRQARLRQQISQHRGG